MTGSFRHDKKLVQKAANVTHVCAATGVDSRLAWADTAPVRSTTVLGSVARHASSGEIAFVARHQELPVLGVVFCSENEPGVAILRRVARR